jgi:hypothetical protein
MPPFVKGFRWSFSWVVRCPPGAGTPCPCRRHDPLPDDRVKGAYGAATRALWLWQAVTLGESPAGAGRLGVAAGRLRPGAAAPGGVRGCLPAGDSAPGMDEVRAGPAAGPLTPRGSTRHAYYASRACVVVSRSAVVVRNPLRHVAVPLNEVSGFDVDSHFRGAAGNRTSIVLLHRTDGSSVRCAGATSYSSFNGCARMAKQLNGALGRDSFPGPSAGRRKRAVLELQEFAARLGKKPAELTKQEQDRFPRGRNAGGLAGGPPRVSWRL